jgi:hypothetical protein
LPSALHVDVTFCVLLRTGYLVTWAA